MSKVTAVLVMLALFGIFVFVAVHPPTVNGPDSISARRAAAIREARQGR